jgi:hypothetical protein
MITLYHGSNIVVERPDLTHSRITLDFGAGFYSTTNREQAVNFAQKVMVRKEPKTQWVTVYEFDLRTAASVLNSMRFSAPDKAWLDFVFQNRRGIYNGLPYDLVIGPVANDDVFTTFQLYESGVLSEDQTLEALKIKKLFDQFVLKNEKALAFLKYKDSFDPRDIK